MSKSRPRPKSRSTITHSVKGVPQSGRCREIGSEQKGYDPAPADPMSSLEDGNLYFTIQST